jgi:hypothetical protein
MGDRGWVLGGKKYGHKVRPATPDDVGQVYATREEAEIAKRALDEKELSPKVRLAQEERFRVKAMRRAAREERLLELESITARITEHLLNAGLTLERSDQGSLYFRGKGSAVRVSDHKIPLTRSRLGTANEGGFSWALSAMQIILHANPGHRFSAGRQLISVLRRLGAR